MIPKQAFWIDTTHGAVQMMVIDTEKNEVRPVKVMQPFVTIRDGATQMNEMNSLLGWSGLDMTDISNQLYLILKAKENENIK